MSKYKAVPTVVDNIRFASKKEARRYGELKLLQRAKQIADLKLQPRIKCQANGVHICDYVADFFYTEKGQPVYEDVKSEFTRKLRELYT
jgi:hypothetical protein